MILKDPNPMEIPKEEIFCHKEALLKEYRLNITSNSCQPDPITNHSKTNSKHKMRRVQLTPRPRAMRKKNKNQKNQIQLDLINSNRKRKNKALKGLWNSKMTKIKRVQILKLSKRYQSKVNLSKKVKLKAYLRIVK